MRPMTAAVIARSSSAGPNASPLMKPCVGAVSIAVKADNAPRQDSTAHYEVRSENG